MLGDDEYLNLSMPVPEWDMPEALTDAERAVTLAVLRGATNDQVARERRTSARTIANQLTSIFAKLGVTSRIELAHRLRKKQGA
jgi:DNA-binding NarL/FixJ family response regulator